MIKKLSFLISIIVLVFMTIEFVLLQNINLPKGDLVGLDRDVVWEKFGPPGRIEDELKGGDAWGGCGLIVCKYVRISYDDGGRVLVVMEGYK